MRGTLITPLPLVTLEVGGDPFAEILMGLAEVLAPTPMALFMSGALASDLSIKDSLPNTLSLVPLLVAAAGLIKSIVKYYGHGIAVMQ